MPFRPLPILLVLALGISSGRSQEAMLVETVARVKEATTFIRTSFDSGPDGPRLSGSGFVIGGGGLRTTSISTSARTMRPAS